MNPSIFIQAIRHKARLFRSFYVLYVFLCGLYGLFTFWSIEGTHRAVIYEAGIHAGQIAVVLFCFSILAGIMRRFGIRHASVAFLTSIRRHLGISMFALAFLHYSSIRLFPILFGGVALNLEPPLFELFGVLSFFLLSPLFFTSNDWSVRHFGVWWKRIHSLVYIIVWSIFLHLSFQEVSVFSVLIGVCAVLETISLGYFYMCMHPRT